MRTLSWDIISHIITKHRAFRLHGFVEKLCYELVGTYRRLLPMKIRPNTVYKLTDHTKYRIAHATSNDRYIMCLRDRVRQHNSSAEYKDHPKMSKTVYCLVIKVWQ